MARPAWRFSSFSLNGAPRGGLDCFFDHFHGFVEYLPFLEFLEGRASGSCTGCGSVQLGVDFVFFVHLDNFFDKGAVDGLAWQGAQKERGSGHFADLFLESEIRGTVRRAIYAFKVKRFDSDGVGGLFDRDGVIPRGEGRDERDGRICQRGEAGDRKIVQKFHSLLEFADGARGLN